MGSHKSIILEQNSLDSKVLDPISEGLGNHKSTILALKSLRNTVSRAKSHWFEVRKSRVPGSEGNGLEKKVNDLEAGSLPKSMVSEPEANGFGAGSPPKPMVLGKEVND